MEKRDDRNEPRTIWDVERQLRTVEALRRVRQLLMEALGHSFAGQEGGNECRAALAGAVEELDRLLYG